MFPTSPAMPPSPIERFTETAPTGSTGARAPPRREDPATRRPPPRRPPGERDRRASKISQPYPAQARRSPRKGSPRRARTCRRPRSRLPTPNFPRSASRAPAHRAAPAPDQGRGPRKNIVAGGPARPADPGRRRGERGPSARRRHPVPRRVPVRSAPISRCRRRTYTSTALEPGPKPRPHPRVSTRPGHRRNASAGANSRADGSTVRSPTRARRVRGHRTSHGARRGPGSGEDQERE